MVLFSKILFSVAAFAVAASAQQGKFTLPFETHWAGAVLAPGEYTLAPAMTVTWPRVFAVSGQGRTVYILASIDKLADVSEGNYLEIEDAGGARVVRELHLGFTGKSFHFAIPKALRAQLASRTTPRQATAKVAVGITPTQGGIE